MISIICFGNTLCSDDGVGYAVFRQLQTMLEVTPNWQTEVKLNYAGNSGQRSLPYFIDSELVIVVDALLVSKLDRVGTLGMCVNFVVAIVVNKFTAEVPDDVQDMVESIRYPKGAGQAHHH